MEKHGDVSAYFSDSNDDFKNKSGILASSVNLYDSICLGYAEGQQGVQTYMPSPNPHPNPVTYLGAVLDAINADLDNPDTPMIPMHAITLIRDAFTAVGVDFDLSKGVAA
jgi:hypothetical protein